MGLWVHHLASLGNTALWINLRDSLQIRKSHVDCYGSEAKRKGRAGALPAVPVRKDGWWFGTGARKEPRECCVDQKNIVAVAGAEVLPAVSVAKTSIRFSPKSE